MSFREPFFPLPHRARRIYLIGRVVLYLGSFILIAFFTVRIVFPTVPFTFNFRTPASTKNSFLDPRLATDHTPLNHGKLDPGQSLLGNFDSPGTFSRARVTFDLSKKSATAKDVHASIARSYRAFFLPIDDTPVASFPHPPLYKDQSGIYYQEEGKTLKRFVSTAAYLSRYPESFAISLPASPARTLPLSEEWVGFRVGSLISFAEGVFLVTSEHEIRPFGDPNIFLSMGYRFDDVISAHEEEIGIYTRGRILLYGAAQSDGTVFHDTDSDTYLIVDQHQLRPITSPEYRDFLLEHLAPIEASLSTRHLTLSCLPDASWITPRTFSCDIPESTLSADFGSAFELTLSNPESGNPLDMDALTVSLITDRTQSNFRLFASQIKTRLLGRFGSPTP